MRYTVHILRTAIKAVARLPRDVQGRIVVAIESLAESPRPTGAKKLVGRESMRLRVGDYRVIYEVGDEHHIVQVVAVSHRKDAYRP